MSKTGYLHKSHGCIPSTKDKSLIIVLLSVDVFVYSYSFAHSQILNCFDFSKLEYQLISFKVLRCIEIGRNKRQRSTSESERLVSVSCSQRCRNSLQNYHNASNFIFVKTTKINWVIGIQDKEPEIRFQIQIVFCPETACILHNFLTIMSL